MKQQPKPKKEKWVGPSDPGYVYKPNPRNIALFKVLIQSQQKAEQGRKGVAE
jgi:hypothetical protein